jgi:hypothetical protein
MVTASAEIEGLMRMVRNAVKGLCGRRELNPSSQLASYFEVASDAMTGRACSQRHTYKGLIY